MSLDKSLEHKSPISEDTIVLPEKKLRKDISIVTKKSTSIKSLKQSGFTVGDNITKLLASINDTKVGDTKTRKQSALALQIDRKGGKVGLPSNIESVASDLFIQKVMLVCTKLKIEMIPAIGQYIPKASSTDDDFWNGFFEELISTKTVEKVQYSKSSSFVNGRACARYELIKGLIPSDNQSWIRHIHKEIMGSKNVKPMLERTLAKRYTDESERREALIFLKDFSHLVLCVENYGKKKIAIARFFDTFDELLSLCKRRKKQVDKKTRGKKKQTSATVNATKPSALKSVIPFERSAVQELWEAPWQQLESLREIYIKSRPEDVDRGKLLKRLRAIVTAQWAAKTAVLKQTRHRVVKLSQTSRLQDDLSNTQKVLGVIKDEDSYVEYITQKEKTISILPIGRHQYEGTTFMSFYSFLEQKGQHIYPNAYAIKQCYDQTGISKRLEKALGDGGKVKRKRTENKTSSSNSFEALEDDS
jgi:hypothetical protein